MDDDNTHYDPYRKYPQPQLPPIVIVNSMKDKRSRRVTEDDDEEYTSSEDYRVRPGRAKRTSSKDPELREEAGGALLLRSSKTNTPSNNEPIVV